MKPRKASELRQLTTEELRQLLREQEQLLQKLRFQHELKQLENTAALHTVRKDIARIKTILHERGIRV
ncbi:MAG: 50S ribosomal protein L29 [Chlorobiota bacterium]|jgi:large subunit ribosomal protein L29|nr:50S ribosomal protein L29 [Chlorobiota bacterium]